MREVGVVFGVMGVMGAIAFATAMPWETAFPLGLWVTAAGFVLGVPTGLVYHVRLYRALAPRGALPSDWLLRPISLHDRLYEDERPGVLLWCYAGGAGFFVICLGLLLLGSATITAILVL